MLAARSRRARTNSRGDATREHILQGAVDLLHDAHLSVVGGGATVVHALALGKAVVAAPTGAGDQPRRVKTLGRHRLVEASELDVEAMATAAIGLLEDPARLETLRTRVAQSGMENGMERAVAAVRDLLERS